MFFKPKKESNEVNKMFFNQSKQKSDEITKTENTVNQVLENFAELPLIIDMNKIIDNSKLTLEEKNKLHCSIIEQLEIAKMMELIRKTDSLDKSSFTQNYFSKTNGK